MAVLLASCGLDEEVEALVADVTPLNGHWISDAGSGRADDLYSRIEITFFFDSSAKKYFSDDHMLGGGEHAFKVRKQDGDLYRLNMNGYTVTVWLMTGDTALMIIDGESRFLPLTKQQRDERFAGAP